MFENPMHGYSDSLEGKSKDLSVTLDLVPPEYAEVEFEIFDMYNLIATVYYNINTQEVRVEQFTTDEVIKPFLREPVTIPDIMDFLEDRCFPRTRFNCDELLSDLGLRFYDPLAIVKKTHGLQLEDYTWVRFKGDTITYDDIKIRD